MQLICTVNFSYNQDISLVPRSRKIGATSYKLIALLGPKKTIGTIAVALAQIKLLFAALVAPTQSFLRESYYPTASL